MLWQMEEHGGKKFIIQHDRQATGGKKTRLMAYDNVAISVMRVLDMLLALFKPGHSNPLPLEFEKGRQHFCCRPLIACQQRRAGLSTAGVAHLLAVDWLGWLCY